jgi:peroxiredoxin
MKKKIIVAVLLLGMLPFVKAVFSQPYATAPVNPPAPVKPTGPRQPVSAPFDAERFKGKTVLLLAYSIDNPRAAEAVQFIQDMYRIRGEYNFEVLGLNINDNRTDEVVKFNQKQNATFPLLLENPKAAAKGLNLVGDLSLYIFNKQGELIGSMAAANIPPQRNLSQALHVYVNRLIKIGFVPADEPVLGDRPPVPLFNFRTIDGNKLRMDQLYAVKPVVLVFFSPSCSHCRDELAFLNSLMAGAEFKDRFFLVAVSRLNQEITAKFIKEQGYAFPIALDADNSISSLFPSFVGVVPMGYIIDRSGRIFAKHTGFSGRMMDVYLMELRMLCGLPNTPLLDPKGYSGQDRCAICHEKEYVQWSLTRHPYAFKSLQRKGKEDDPACVSCHVTGWGKPEGYAMNEKKDSKTLEGVQCESCHGPGYEACTAFTGTKPHKKNSEEWQALCRTCHTEKESLNFNFARRFPKVLHSAPPDIASLSREQRVKLLTDHKRNNDLFGNAASYAGAASCKKCHELEYAQWSKTAHAAAADSPAAASAPPDKKYRFTTGSGSPGGYPAPGRLGVQCEACHGPGERHVKDPQKKGQDYIVALSGSCDNCVVEQICRSCHGPDDDPKFKFEQYRETIRHKPKQ